jgi:acyl carrier protein
MTDTREIIVQTILDIVKPEQPDLSDHSRALLGADTLDSLDFASLLMALEDEFDVAFDEDAEQLGSIDQLVAFVDAKKGRAH